MLVKIEPIKVKNKNIIQCKRCKSYGHSQAYCWKQARCVKCAGKHLTAFVPISVWRVLSVQTVEIQVTQPITEAAPLLRKFNKTTIKLIPKINMKIIWKTQNSFKFKHLLFFSMHHCCLISKNFLIFSFYLADTTKNSCFSKVRGTFTQKRYWCSNILNALNRINLIT